MNRISSWRPARHLFRCLLMALALGGACGAQARGPWRASEHNTPGWRFMSPAERVEHQAAVRRFRDYDECHAYQLAHHRLMESRARQSGLPLPRNGRDLCAHLRPPARR
jgi:hypothetical protein